MSQSAYRVDWDAPAPVRAWQSTRAGGSSVGAYASMNLGLHVGDDETRVRVNRQRLQSSLGLPGEPHWLDQVHGTRILDLDAGDSGEADGAVTGVAGKVLAVMTADCLPVLFADNTGSRVGVAHAGWRGLAAGVLDRAVEALSSPADSLLAWLGPAIGSAAFEVGDEVRAAFVDRYPDDALAFERNSQGRWQADLHLLARRQLERAGVVRIYGNPDCTRADPERYFSHRREAPCGRMASLIWLDPGV